MPYALRKDQMNQYKSVSLREFTFLQRRVLIELLNPEWTWRTEKSILEAIEDERQRIIDWVADDVATLLDREERPTAVIRQLIAMNMMKVQTESHHNGKCITSTTWYRIHSKWKALR